MVSPQDPSTNTAGARAAQVGDQLDRGDDEIPILFFLERLKREARAAGGEPHRRHPPALSSLLSRLARTWHSLRSANEVLLWIHRLKGGREVPPSLPRSKNVPNF